MTEAITKTIQQEHRFDVFTSSFSNVEIADDNQRAIILIPLMHVGANKKGLYWTEEMLKKLSKMFRGIPFRYDLDGVEGSSHTLNKLSSPHFDVGWTYSSEEGAWYDKKTKALWVKGEVTHPDVISKLSRSTTDGKREVNYASMGVIVEKAICTICGADFENYACTNGHERNKAYNGKRCYKVPTEISKALHAALTNDPADGEAEIKNVIIQELRENYDGDYEAGPQDKRKQAGEQMEKSQLDSQIPGGLAPSSPQTEQPGEAPSPQTVLKDLAERIKTIEQKLAKAEETPELINASPQDQFTQSNMGTTTQFEAKKEKQQEENKMDAKAGQTTNEKVPVNPKPEVQESGSDNMSKIMSMLEKILSRLSAESADMGKESLDAGKGMAKKAQEDIPTEHIGTDTAKKVEEPGNVKNKKAMLKPDKVENADDEVEEAKVEKADDEEDEVAKLKAEIADMKKNYKELRSKLEIQDNELPEFGGTNTNTEKVDVADMGAKGRTEQFGEYGAWDSIFNGPESAIRFRR